MTEQLFLTLLISLCTKSNDLNYSHKELKYARLECMVELSKCAKKPKTKDGFISLQDFMEKCSKGRADG